MGWVSYMEDAVDRWTTHFNELERQAEPGDIGPDHEQAVRLLLEHARQILVELRDHLELATDPALDLAHELRNQRRLAEEARNRAGKAVCECNRMGAVNQNLKLIHDRLENQITGLKCRNEALKDELNEFIQKCPETAIEMYVTKERRRRHKRNP